MSALATTTRHQPKNRWSRRELERLRESLAKGRTLNECTQRVYHSASECDLAAWAMLGRSIEDAMNYLNGAP